MNAYPAPAPPSFAPGGPPPISHDIQGAIPLGPTAQPMGVPGVPLPRDANNQTSSTMYVFPNRESVMATSF
jgi:hypothetical protein